MIELENANNVVQQGLPSSQFSFLLGAGTDTLPIPLNLRRWHLKVDSSCLLCGSKQPAIHYVLSKPEALQQGRYTWRHDSVLQSLVRDLKHHVEPDMVLCADYESFRQPHSRIDSRLP